jgi:hypothetical protein
MLYLKKLNLNHVSSITAPGDELGEAPPAPTVIG